jgi:hypothetical protein
MEILQNCRISIFFLFDFPLKIKDILSGIFLAYIKSRTAIKQSIHGFKAFINAMRLFCCLFILLNAKGNTEVALKQREGSALRYR